MPSGHVHPGSLDLPFSGAVAVSRHCSYHGALSASERVGRQSLQLLTAYAERGSLTDAEMETGIGIDRSTICARRNGLIRRGLVIADGTRKNEKSGILNTLWRLTTAEERTLILARQQQLIARE